jgi:hypothetical protein
MGKFEPTRADIELGGMRWEVTPAEELQTGHAFRMRSVEDFSRGPDYPMADRTTITRLDDGSVHVAFASERNKDYYSASHEFPAGALRAIVDHVELSGGSRVEQTSANVSRPLQLARRVLGIR